MNWIKNLDGRARVIWNLFWWAIMIALIVVSFVA